MCGAKKADVKGWVQAASAGPLEPRLRRAGGARAGEMTGTPTAEAGFEGRGGRTGEGVCAGRANDPLGRWTAVGQTGVDVPDDEGRRAVSSACTETSETLAASAVRDFHGTPPVDAICGDGAVLGTTGRRLCAAMIDRKSTGGLASVGRRAHIGRLVDDGGGGLSSSSLS